MGVVLSTERIQIQYDSSPKIRATIEYIVWPFGSIDMSGSPQCLRMRIYSFFFQYLQFQTIRISWEIVLANHQLVDVFRYRVRYFTYFLCWCFIQTLYFLKAHNYLNQFSFCSVYINKILSVTPNYGLVRVICNSKHCVTSMVQF